MALPDNPITTTEQYLDAIARGEGILPPWPVSRVEQYLEEIAKTTAGMKDEQLELFKASIQLSCTVETDVTNGIYKVRSWLNGVGSNLDACCPYCGAVGDKVAITTLFSAHDVDGKHVKDWYANRYWAKSWTDDYDPDTDGVLTPDNAPNKAKTDIDKQPVDGGRFFTYTNTYSNSGVVGYKVNLRWELVITYDDDSTKTIWSSQTEVEVTDGGSKVRFFHDADSGNEPTDIVCAGWVYTKDEWPFTWEQGLYSSLVTNVTAIIIADKYMVADADSFEYNGDSCSLAQFLVFGDGTKRYYGVLSDPGLLSSN